MCLLVICRSFYYKVYSDVCWVFLIGSFLLFHRVTYIFWTLILSWLFALQVPSLFCDLYIFTLIMVTLVKRILMESNLCNFFSVMVNTMSQLKKNPLPGAKNILSCSMCLEVLPFIFKQNMKTNRKWQVWVYMFLIKSSAVQGLHTNKNLTYKN